MGVWRNERCGCGMIHASVPVHLGPPRTSHASRALLGSLLVVLVVLSISPTAAVTVRITCHDGSPNARVASKGHHRTLPAVCDLDGAVDGVCTFYSEGTVLKCAINGGPGCQDVSDDSSAPPCPFSSLPIALPLGHAGHAAKRIRVIKNGVYPSDRFIMRCLPPRQPESTTTSTTLPGVPSLSGVWTLADNNLVEGCPPGAQTPTLAPSIIMQQMGTSLAACVMGYLNFTGETSEAGFTSDPAGDLSDLGIGTAEWMGTVSGMVLASGDIAVTERWKLRFATCENVRTGIMTRYEPSCVSQQDCIRLLGPCSRCLGGRCQSQPPFCHPSQ